MRNPIEKSLDDEKDLDAVDQFSDSERRIMYVPLAILPIRVLTYMEVDV
jgi:hypothetical protein